MWNVSIEAFNSLENKESDIVLSDSSACNRVCLVASAYQIISLEEFFISPLYQKTLTTAVSPSPPVVDAFQHGRARLIRCE